MTLFTLNLKPVFILFEHFTVKILLEKSVSLPEIFVFARFFNPVHFGTA